MNIFFTKKQRNRDNKNKSSWKITKRCLNLINECAKSNYPREFAGLLRTNEKKVIDEIVMLPGTVSGDAHAIFKLHMLPIDFSIKGTVHSHPSPSFSPSNEDLNLFRKYGKVHIIAAKPFNLSSWQAYGYNGNKIDLEVISE